MCTVTFVPLKSGFTLTSNRDEVNTRLSSVPEEHQENENLLVYPKDPLKNGSWVALAPNMKRVACLLNGAFEIHERQESYRLSRGQILLDSFNYTDISSFASKIDLYNVEPFTLVIVDYEDKGEPLLYEFRWDGEQKHLTPKNASRKHIWSSATLYDRAARNARELWFNSWLNNNMSAEDYNIIDFHKSTHGEDVENDIVMKRGDLETLSVSQITLEKEKFTFSYADLLNKEDHSLTFENA